MLDCYLESALFGYTNSLSNTTKLILLDSLLQEVCIESGLPSLVTSLFLRTKESPLSYFDHLIVSLSLCVFFVRSIEDHRGSAYYDNVRMVFR